MSTDDLKALISRRLNAMARDAAWSDADECLRSLRCYVDGPLKGLVLAEIDSLEFAIREYLVNRTPELRARLRAFVEGADEILRRVYEADQEK